MCMANLVLHAYDESESCCTCKGCSYVLFLTNDVMFSRVRAEQTVLPKHAAFRISTLTSLRHFRIKLKFKTSFHEILHSNHHHSITSILGLTSCKNQHEMTDQTFHTTREDLRKPESQISKANDGNIPADSEPSLMQVCSPPPKIGHLSLSNSYLFVT